MRDQPGPQLPGLAGRRRELRAVPLAGRGRQLMPYLLTSRYQDIDRAGEAQHSPAKLSLALQSRAKSSTAKQPGPQLILGATVLDAIDNRVRSMTVPHEPSKGDRRASSFPLPASSVHHRKSFFKNMNSSRCMDVKNVTSTLAFKERQSKEHRYIRADHNGMLDKLMSKSKRWVGNYRFATLGQFLGKKITPVEVRRILVV